jgi:hypothetical protein
MTSTVNADTNAERPARVSQAVLLLKFALALGAMTGAVHVIRAVAGTTMMIALIIVIAFFALGFLLVWRISRGNNWARILLIVLVVIGTPLSVPGYVRDLKHSLARPVVSLLITILQLVGTYLLFSGSSNAWFRRTK